jgi:SAM-dependent methyltransferase
MDKNKLKLNKFCPIRKSEKIQNKNKIQSKHCEINLIFSLVKCLNCNHRFLSKFPTKQYLEELYKNNSKYVFSHEFHENYEKNKFKNEGFEKVKSFKEHWIFNFIDINKSGEYLEIGPGLCRLYKTFHEKKWLCEGLDLQPFIKAPGIVNNLKKIKDNSKDVAVALDVIEHSIDPDKFLQNINKKLKINGKVFLCFPNSDSFKSKFLNNKWDMVVPLAHLNFFSKKSIKISLEKNNFKLKYLKIYSLVNPKRFFKNLIKLPFKLLKDLIFLNFSIFFNRFKELFITFFDMIYGDQMMIMAEKIK